MTLDIKLIAMLIVIAAVGASLTLWWLMIFRPLAFLAVALCSWGIVGAAAIVIKVRHRRADGARIPKAVAREI